MDHLEAGKYWNENAETWTELARKGYDIYRDYLNTPAFFSILPDIKGLRGIDIGCGEGYNTRLLAEKGALMSAIDISEIFIEKAREVQSASAPIDYRVASALQLPFNDEHFDFATGFMSFMDIPETEALFRESFRVLKKGGFLQFSISHPCFDTPHRKNLRNALGRTYAIEVGDYFKNVEGEVDEWIFRSTPAGEHSNLRKFKTPRFTRTLNQWMNALISAGFVLEYVHEPRPTEEAIRLQPKLQDSMIVAYFLHLRCRKK
ncbi:MAG: class I SAM-dependent methyltransferase [Flavisolibacter sp.]